jgi:hypothetical protein
MLWEQNPHSYVEHKEHKPQHTPTPWTIDADRFPDAVQIRSSKGLLIADDCLLENAAYIVKCVNAHEELISVLKLLINEDVNPMEFIKHIALAKAEGEGE